MIWLAIAGADGVLQTIDAPNPAEWSSAAAAWAALLLAIGAIGFQAWSRWADGGRIRVRMTPGYWVPNSLVAQRNTGEWPMAIEDDDTGIFSELRVGEGFELALISVDNIGRIPLTITELGLTWQVVVNGKSALRHVSPRVLDLSKFDHPEYSGSGELRIEPYCRKLFALDYWSTLEPGRAEARGVREIRASATVMGRRPTRSSKKLAWRIPDMAVSSLSKDKVAPIRHFAVRGLIRAGVGYDPWLPSFVGYLARLIEAEVVARGAWPTDYGEQVNLVEQGISRELGSRMDQEARFAWLLNATMMAAEEIQANIDAIDWDDIGTPSLVEQARQPAPETGRKRRQREALERRSQDVVSLRTTAEEQANETGLHCLTTPRRWLRKQGRCRG